MNKDIWFLLSLPILYGIGYLYGKYALPKMLRHPFQAMMVGRSFFFLFTIFLIVRGLWTFFFSHHSFDMYLTVCSYVSMVILSLGVTLGYNSFTLQYPSSLATAIKTLNEQGVVLANPFSNEKKKVG